MSVNFWSSKDLEPKRQFRFIISLQPGISGQELRFAAKTADRPSYTIGEQEHRFFNHTFYYPGRMNWNTVGMTLVDAIEPGSTELLYDYLADIGIQQPRDFKVARQLVLQLLKSLPLTHLAMLRFMNLEQAAKAKQGLLENGL